MKDFDSKAVEKLAKLAALELSEEELAGFANDLNSIIKHAEKLQEVDVEGIEPCDHVLEDMQITLREDEIKETGLPTEVFLDNSPEHIGNMIKVPTVID